MTDKRNFLKLILFVLWTLILSAGVAIGVVGGFYVLRDGLVITNLTDLVPWGLWIGIDLSAIAVSAGAFSLCALVYLVGLKQYEPVARTATFIGIIGYSMAMLCLFMDIGRPDRFWHGFVFWNTHSVLWEVTMCVGLYFSVLLVETLPIIADWEWLQRVFPGLTSNLKKIHALSPILAILGLTFSLLHQSSLGATYGVLQSRPAWYRPTLPILFIFSAVLGGISLTIFASMLSARISSHAKVKDELFSKLSKALGWALMAYLYFRFWDTFSLTYNYQPGRSESLTMLTSGQLAFGFWILEIFLGTFVPMIIFLNDRWRETPAIRMTALILVVVGLVAYRWDTNMVGQLIVLTYLPREIFTLYTRYVPSNVEIAVGVGIFSYGLLAFTLGVRYLRVVDHSLQAHHAHHVPKPVKVPLSQPVPEGGFVMTDTGQD